MTSRETQELGSFSQNTYTLCKTNYLHPSYHFQVIKVWDIKEHYCIQSMHLKYPYDPHHLDHGPFPMILLPSPAHALLITCEDYLTELKLNYEPNNKMNKTSHERPLLAVIYNERKKQVNTNKIIGWK